MYYSGVQVFNLVFSCNIRNSLFVLHLICMIFTAIKIHVVFFCTMRPRCTCILVGGYRRIGEHNCPHLQDKSVKLQAVSFTYT
jgi:hypothetical protein